MAEAGNPSPGPASEERQWPTAREREGDSGLSCFELRLTDFARRDNVSLF
jgi:hypothetical protein